MCFIVNNESAKPFVRQKLPFLFRFLFFLPHQKCPPLVGICLLLFIRGFFKVMVCQSPGKTRFRALKYETGDANKPTIVVRVIACFQPMDNCQAEYFRLLLKPVT